VLASGLSLLKKDKNEVTSLSDRPSRYRRALKTLKRIEIMATKITAEKTPDKILISINDKAYVCSNFSFERILKFASSPKVVKIQNYIGVQFSI
jgi:cytochrome b involved in lipid metabolism